MNVETIREDGQEMDQIMQMILLAGDAQTAALGAFDCIADGRYGEAESKLTEARKSISQAHRIHAGFLTQVADMQPNVLLIHALDHLTMATIYTTLAEKMAVVVKKMEERGTNK